MVSLFWMFVPVSHLTQVICMYAERKALEKKTASKNSSAELVTH